ncbi:abortive infection system antitoxin AbiGi family protein [Aeromicrobium sp. 9AM]|uniref:abortive infection system antitoxin AbiGi family protein n=1 Tax=Aeromicrobium sp. 9AM TaxID=2653126 RepID=UPI0012F0CE48|nr:abortive infection system antitoxin AbiGi family protein [Aeromicrobium sp. 9AM]VXC09844.1 conserved hypothetical protein [Aeromicrobium sp. 9AM]
MADKIEDLLQRRTDLSTFLIHLTRKTKNFDARSNLLGILREHAIIARTELGMAQTYATQLDGTAATQRVVCFTETPLEHAWMMTREIENRQRSFAPYGVVFTKTTCRRRSCNPVWYLDITPGHDWLTPPINELVKMAVENSTVKKGQIDNGVLAAQPIFRLTPFIEQMGKPLEVRKEFWWEREWRHAGDFSFSPRSVVAVLAPRSEHGSLETEIAALDERWKKRKVPLLDPEWGLERMIAALARIDEDDAGPWPE